MKSGWNVIGFSSNDTYNLSDVYITNSTGNWNFSYAYDTGLIRNITFLNDSLDAFTGIEIYESFIFHRYDSFSVYANQTSNWTFVDLNGLPVGYEYLWTNIHFNNGTDEVGADEAIDNSWVQNPWYWNGVQFKGISTLGLTGKNNISSWEGIFIYGNYDNITMLTDSTSHVCETCWKVTLLSIKKCGITILMIYVKEVCSQQN